MKALFWCTKCGTDEIDPTTTPTWKDIPTGYPLRHAGACSGVILEGPMPRFECGMCGMFLGAHQVSLAITLAPHPREQTHPVPSPVGTFFVAIPTDARILYFHNSALHPTNETPGWLRHAHDVATVPLWGSDSGMARMTGRLDACGPLYPVEQQHTIGARNTAHAELDRAIRAARFPADREDALLLLVERMFGAVPQKHRVGERPFTRIGFRAELSPREMVLLRWVLDGRSAFNRDGWEEGETDGEYLSALHDFLHNLDVLGVEPDLLEHTFDTVHAQLAGVDRRDFPR